MAESHFLPTVTLFDWWLVKSPNNRLSISGISSRKGEAVRVFNSSPIVRRYDYNYLETADGISILIRGIINEERTLESGFTPQIFKSFYIGFPSYWESCALDCFREEAEPITDSVNAVMDTVSAAREDISSEGDQNSIPTSLVLPEQAAEECNDSKEMSGYGVAYGSGGDRRSTSLRDNKVCQQKQQQPASGGSLRHPDKEQSSFSKGLENHDSDTVVLDNVSENLPEISSHAVEKSFPTFVSLEKAATDCKQFVEDEHDISIKMSEVNIVQCSVGNRRSARLHNLKVYPRKQPTIGGPSKHPDENQIFASTSLEKREGGQKSPSTPIESQSKTLLNTFSEQVVGKFASRVSKTLSAKTDRRYKKKRVSIEIEAVRPNIKSPHVRDVSHLNQGSEQSVYLESLSLKKSKYGEQNSIPTSLVLPEHTAEECNDSTEMSGCDVAYGSGGDRRSTSLRDIKVCQQKQQQPASGGSLRHPDKEQSSFSKGLENHDSGTVVLDNVSENLPEISSHAVGKSFPTFVSPEKAATDCKQFVEDEHDISIKMSEVNIVQCSVGNRRSARLHNLKVYPRKQPTIGGPSKHPDENQIFASTSLEKREGGQKSPSTPIESQSKTLLNTFSEQVVGKFASRVSKTLSAKTDRRCKKKRVSIEIEAVRPKIKFPHVRDVSHLNLGSEIKSPHVRDVSHLNQGSGIKSPHVRDVSHLNQGGGIKSPHVRDVSHLNQGSKIKSPHVRDVSHLNQGSEIKSPHVRDVSHLNQGSKIKSPHVRDVSHLNQGSEIKSPHVRDVSHLNQGSEIKSPHVRDVSHLNQGSKIKSPHVRDVSHLNQGSEIKSPHVRDVSHLNQGSKIKSPHVRDVSHLNQGSEQSVSLESLSLKKSKYGRSLLPPLEFWHNQIPIYNTDREITKIQEGSSLISPIRGSSPSLGRSAEIIRGGKRIVLSSFPKL
ncbi:uncharacterized protein LOC127093321 isoform X1 [Lathyrus oleraceus]|uniref:SANTA domain-containing protein n=1 Tax=Pisum sativum TaxID=3888 RepID=A0A9D4W5J4_PEA|nr:uncharacterized protein LOC127093321 isoform X1 [Pisum sativum]KAI5395358.1 hypothetical protein KIW84_061811 [Pisum sativum]